MLTGQREEEVIESGFPFDSELGKVLQNVQLVRGFGMMMIHGFGMMMIIIKKRGKGADRQVRKRQS